MASSLVLAIFLYTASYHIGRAATSWQAINSCGMPSNSASCQVGSAINTSASIQTKIGGSLTLNNGLTVSNLYAHTCDADHSVHCSIDADCTIVGVGSSCNGPAMLLVDNPSHTANFKWTNLDDSTVTTLTGWDATSTASYYVDLSPSTLREGYMAVANSPATVGNTAAINVLAAIPDLIGGKPSYAVKASDNASTVVSYAVRAKAGFNDIKSTALRAIAPYDQVNHKGALYAWAAYFSGNVSVRNHTDEHGNLVAGNVVMEGTGDLDSTINSSLCLGGYDAAHPRVCYAEWPSEAVGDNQWYDTAGYMQVRDSSLNFAIGGNSSSAPFYLTARPNSAADLVVNGVGQSLTLTIQ